MAETARLLFPSLRFCTLCMSLGFAHQALDIAESLLDGVEVG